MVAPPDEPCPRCGGSGWVLVDDGSAGTASRCACRPVLDAARRLERAAIPPRYSGATLRGFNVASPSGADRLLEARELSRRYVDGFFESGRPRRTGLIYIGPPGAGKTHLAVAVLKALIERYGVGGHFIDFTALVHEIQSTFDPGSEESKRQVLDPILHAEVLVLDELGAQRPTPFVNDTLYLVLNHRYTRCLPTIFTTNYPVEDAGAPPADLDRAVRRRESLADRIPSRLVSRLHEMAFAIELPVEDFRREVVRAQTRV